MSLTTRIISKATSSNKSYILWDSIVKGFGVRVYPGGRKSYIIRYRNPLAPDPRRKQFLTLGDTRAITLPNARNIASRLILAARSGHSDLALEARAHRQAPTVNEVLDRYFDEYANARLANRTLKPNTIRTYSMLARTIVRPSLGHLRITAVRKTHIENAVLQASQSKHNLTLNFLHLFFKLCEKWELIPRHGNPTPTDRFHIPPRDRTLTDTEIKRLILSLDHFRPRFTTAVAAIEFAMLTGLRIGEILSIEWSHINDEDMRLFLPDTKTGARFHDLPDSAFDILRPLPRTHSHVFISKRGRPISYNTINRFFIRLRTHAGLPDIRIHDTRRTFMTRAARAGFNAHVIRDLLGHRSAQTADRYVRHVGEPVRQARCAVSSSIASLAEDVRDNSTRN